MLSARSAVVSRAWLITVRMSASSPWAGPSVERKSTMARRVSSVWNARRLVGAGGDIDEHTVDEQLIDLASGNGIETGARFVDEKDVRVERHGTRETGPLSHAAREFGGHLVEIVVEPDFAELGASDLADF